MSIYISQSHTTFSSLVVKIISLGLPSANEKYLSRYTYIRCSKERKENPALKVMTPKIAVSQ